MCWLFGHWWYWWTKEIREKQKDMLPGFVYSCKRCPAMYSLRDGLQMPKEASCS